jgi:hypothetical protein
VSKPKIPNSNHICSEQGYATQSAGYLRTYVALQNNDSLEGDKIELSVSDLPENITKDSYEL